MSLLVSALSVLVSLFSALIFTGSSPSPTGPAEPSPSPRTFEGLVTVNGEPAPAGIRVTVTLDDQENTRCGDFVTAGGATPFQLILTEACGPGSVALFQVDTGDQSETQVEITENQRSYSTTVDFQLSAAALASLGVPPDGTPDEMVPVVPSSPLKGWDLFVVVVLTVIPAIGLLTLMVLTMGRKNGQRANDDDSTEAASAAGNFRSQIEGMILVMVVLAVILLGVTDKIGSDGLVSVLAAIVGYTVGRHVALGSA